MIPRPDFADADVVKGWIGQDFIKGILLTGDGRHFSAGADLGFFQGEKHSLDEHIKRFNVARDLLSYIEALTKPVVASIDGACMGGGLKIALACHLRYCSTNAIFGFPEVNHGIIPGFGGIKRIMEVSVRPYAMEMLLTGDTYGAGFARRAGIVNEIVENKSAFDYAYSVLEKIISKGYKPVAAVIKAMNNALEMPFEHAMEKENFLFADLVISEFGTAEEEV